MGEPDTHTQIVDGVACITYGEGGGRYIIFTKDSADKYLSDAAIKFATYEGGYLLFEPKDKFIPIFDSPKLRLGFRKTFPYLNICPTEIELDQRLLMMFWRTHIPYLRARGFNGNYDRKAIQRVHEMALKARSPEVVLLMIDQNATLLPGIVQIQTADGNKLLATLDSYQAMDRLKIDRILRRVSTLKLVSEDSVPKFHERLQGYGKEIALQYSREIYDDSRSSRRESHSNHWGPRRNFRHLLSNAVFLVEEYAKREGIDPIEPYINKQLHEIYEVCHPDLKSADTFFKHLWSSSEERSQKLLGQAEGKNISRSAAQSSSHQKNNLVAEPDAGPSMLIS